VGSDGQPRPALGTTGVDNCSTAFGTHACTKAVRTLALQVARLKGSFHGTPGPDIYYDEIIEIIHARKLREKGAKVTVPDAGLST
jgi:hypothetical protein